MTVGDYFWFRAGERDEYLSHAWSFLSEAEAEFAKSILNENFLTFIHLDHLFDEGEYEKMMEIAEHISIESHNLNEKFKNKATQQQKEGEKK